MTAPPARPHAAHVLALSRQYALSTSWDGDDAWDSASDDETSPDRSFTTTPSSSSTRPIPVNRTQPSPVLSSTRRPAVDNAFSYTVVNPPSASSYPPRPPAQVPTPSKSGSNSSQQGSGWTLVTKGKHESPSTSSHRSSREGSGLSTNTPADTDVDTDMIIPGELEDDQHQSKSVASRNTVVLKPEAESIVTDPLRNVHARAKKAEAAAAAPSSSQSGLSRGNSIRTARKDKIIDCLLAEDVDLAALRKIAWSGIVDDVRPVAWQLLLGYLPLAQAARVPALARKREEYASLVRLTFARGRESLDQAIWHQIEIDVPRTRPGVRLWMEAATQRCLERILYVWAIRHPASGYVQGINDLVTPFFQVFLSAYIYSDPEQIDPAQLPEYILNAVEADTFWCLSRLLDGIQDNYISAQPGIHRSVRRMAELVSRIDAPLVEHLKSQNVEFMQFAFRWMNCLLMREISVRNTVRMWDTYLSEGPDAFSQFHLYVCCAFLVKWSEQLRKMDFQGIIMFLQSLPTQGWTDHDIQMLLSQAFVYSTTWQNAQSHFT